MKETTIETPETCLAKAVACEQQAKEMFKKGDDHAARAYKMQAEGWLDEAIERERNTHRAR